MKFCCVIQVIYGQTLPWSKIGPRHLISDSWILFCWTCIWCKVPRWHCGYIPESYNRQHQWQTIDSNHNLLFLQFRLWKAFGCLVMKNYWADCWRWSFFVNSNYLIKKNGWFEFRKNSIEYTSKHRAVWFSLSSFGTYTSSFFTLPIFLRWFEIAEMLKLIA